MHCDTCNKYSTNMPGCWTKGLCLVDMMDARIPEWNVRREADHKCHRPESYQRKAD